MTVATIIPEIWAARMTKILNQQNVFRGLMNSNYEGEISDYGDTVKIGTLSSDVSLHDYTRYTAIAAAERPSTTVQELSIDQAKYWHVNFDDLDRAQAKPDVMEQVIQVAANKMANEVDRFCARLVTPPISGSADDTSLVVAARSVTVGSQASKLPVATPNNRIASAKRIIEGLSDLKTEMFEQNLPRGMRPWIVLTPYIFGLLEKLLTQGSSIDYGGETGSALRRGLVGDMVGFNIEVSKNVADGFVVNGGTNIENRHICPAGTNEAATFASQIVKTEAYRSTTLFADVMRGLHVYGGKLVEPQFLYHLVVNVD